MHNHVFIPKIKRGGILGNVYTIYK